MGIVDTFVELSRMAIVGMKKSRPRLARIHPECYLIASRIPPGQVTVQRATMQNE